MPESFPEHHQHKERVEVVDLSGDVIITLDAMTADVTVVDTASGAPILAFDGSRGALAVGGADNSGSFAVRDGAGRQVLLVHGQGASLAVGSDDNGGTLHVVDSAGRRVCTIDSTTATLTLGAEGNEGDLRILDGEGRAVLEVDAYNAELRVGAKGNEGDFVVHDGEGRRVLHFNAATSFLTLGNEANGGDLLIKDDAGRTAFELSSGTARAIVGTEGNAGDVEVHAEDGSRSIFLDGARATVTAGIVHAETVKASHVIESGGADCAEDFAVRDDVDVTPGMVLVIEDAGTLGPCHAAYDRRVAGIVSGAGDVAPGLVLGRGAATAATGDGAPAGRRLPLALSGKVYCRADARFGPIAVGDLLTTAPTPGHAMKASDPAQAFGAVLGKALAPLDGGTGLVPVLVSLQ
jgi:hypothetical protein